ncbi:hypothetical protein ONS95_007549 [Cadophora gregata]|uniref:uncharacterized protein n=1 Tax=Cadophora gregata TaxID=51156 RepID=UPI0026DB6EC2|nr:uncharacterized protein ONS95_007549 [Cadophora gregata]KAK0118667.1 hypothetical protein ONS96_011754 [Cadophora gregata f. sp. sojae]KAK0125925.1 hypothetical protein ONS95_007549 [Cadophora gregata]
MTLFCPKKHCSSTFKSKEELLAHQEKCHSGSNMTLSKAAAEEARGRDGAKSMADDSTYFRPRDEDKSGMETPFNEQQIVDVPKDHCNACSNPSAIDQNGVQHSEAPTSAGKNLAKDRDAKVAGERVEHAQHSREYKLLPTGMCPRTSETGLRIMSMDLRILEDGLKDLSLEELLGHSSSEQESDDGESNYSW